MNIAIVIIAVVTVLALALGLSARAQHRMNLEEWTVGGRHFGAVLVFMLLAGEIYTTFTFLGASGFAYGFGGPAFYTIGYLTLTYVFAYFLLPKIWRYGRSHGLVTQPDFLAHKYDSPALGALVALVSIVALVPYLVLQLTGLGIIVEVASYGEVSKTAAIIIGTVVVTLYGTISGIRGSAWTAVVKDIMIIGVVVFLGLYLPFHYLGGIGKMFAAVNAAKPGFLALPAHGQSVSWFVSTILLTSLGVLMWPHHFGAIFTASNANVFRKNAVLLPLYQLVLLLVFFVGFTAVMVVPGLKGAATNMALLKISVAAFPPWIVGIIGATGVLTALVPGSLLVMSAATLLARNIVAPLNPRQTDEGTARLAKLFVPVIAAVGCYFAVAGSSTIVALLLMGMAFVTQLAPAVVFSLRKRNPLTKEGVSAGIIAGVAVVAYFNLAHETIGKLLPGLPDVLKDINVGIVALLVNVLVLTVVSVVTAGRRLPLASEVIK
ncbi:MAG TPA: sodium:solute symporter family protein [Acidocella sp.]|uniref:sodium:solute symporter family protein n=1 Tax=Acidocella sp. TaxID=50710 RepID=UPI002D0B2048|nr:sodium:solute symporter family protein [Acidocella sp.]HVE22700.1 sodium:solute symporter family protein [Acidocella sp.]